MFFTLAKTVFIYTETIYRKCLAIPCVIQYCWERWLEVRLNISHEGAMCPSLHYWFKYYYNLHFVCVQIIMIISEIILYKIKIHHYSFILNNTKYTRGLMFKTKENAYDCDRFVGAKNASFSQLVSGLLK